MTSVPTPSDLTEVYTVTYDAWNRLVEVKSGANVVLKCEYDGTGRRTKKHLNTDVDEVYDEFRHFYYNARWQILETRLSESEDAAPDGLQPEYQYVWSLRYIDAPVLWDENDDDDNCIDGQDERLYYLTDVNMNVTCLTDTGGDAVERYVYDPYGNCTVYDDDWSDQVAWAASKKNNIRFCGYFFDNETGLYTVRHRVYHPTLGRWLSRDPVGYADGMGLYEYGVSCPSHGIDPLGLEIIRWLAEGSKYAEASRESIVSRWAFDAIFDDERCTLLFELDIRVNLRGTRGVEGASVEKAKAVLQQLFPKWESSLEKEFNLGKWALVPQQPESCTKCFDGIHLKFAVHFTLDQEKPVHRLVGVAPWGRPIKRANVRYWGRVLDEPGFAEEHYSTVLHEVGHMFGLQDEYYDPDKYPDRGRDDKPKDAKISVMYNPSYGFILKRHVELIAIERAKVNDHHPCPKYEVGGEDPKIPEKWRDLPTAWPCGGARRIASGGGFGMLLFRRRGSSNIAKAIGLTCVGTMLATAGCTGRGCSSKGAVHVFHDRSDARYEYLYVVRQGEVVAQKAYFPGYHGRAFYSRERLPSVLDEELGFWINHSGDVRPPFLSPGPLYIRNDIFMDKGQTKRSVYFGCENEQLFDFMCEMRRAVIREENRIWALPEWIVADERITHSMGFVEGLKGPHDDLSLSEERLWKNTLLAKLFRLHHEAEELKGNAKHLEAAFLLAGIAAALENLVQPKLTNSEPWGWEREALKEFHAAGKADAYEPFLRAKYPEWKPEETPPQEQGDSEEGAGPEDKTQGESSASE